MKNFLRNLSVVFFATSCANIGNISGGDQDITPPQIKRIIPENFHTKSKTNQIQLTFDEYLAATNLRSEITITPEPKKTPKYEIKGKSILIKFEEPLDSNTTYIINFGKGIADLNENNVLEGYFYVFSTGEYIDSNFIRGRILEIVTSEPVSNCLVGLYKSNAYPEDSILFLRPDYYTKTDSNGYFEILYLPEDSFKIVAFTDKNSDFKIQPESELAGVYPLLKHSTDSTPVTLYISPQIPPKRPLIYRLTNPYSCFVTYQTPLHTYKIENLTKNTVEYIHRTPNRDTLLLFFSDEIVDSAVFRLMTSAFSDTLRLLRRQVSDEKLRIQRSTRSDLSVNDEIFFTSNYPISILNKENILIFSNDSATVSKPEKIASEGLSIQLNFEKVIENKYTIQILPKSLFYNEFVFNTDTFSFDFIVKKKEDFGEITLELNLDTVLDNLYLVLQDRKTAQLKETKITQKSTRLSFKELSPGTYHFWMYRDENNNHWWDKGDVFSKKNPEVKIINPENIEVRANWEIEFTWEVSLVEALKRFGH